MSENKNLYMDQINEIPLLSVEKERELAVKAWKGDKEAQNLLVTSNLKFVIKIANSYKGRGLDMQDLIMEGNIGLIIASRKFNPSKNVRFLTYAVWWIRQSIRKALYESGRDVKIPLNRKDEFESNKWHMASLDAVYSDDKDGDTLGDSIRDTKIINVEDKFIEEEQKNNLRKGLEALSDKERKVLNLRYGLDSEEVMSLKEVADLMNYTKEGIRQIELKAINNLRKKLITAA